MRKRFFLSALVRRFLLTHIFEAITIGLGIFIKIDILLCLHGWKNQIFNALVPKRKCCYVI